MPSTSFFARARAAQIVGLLASSLAATQAATVTWNSTGWDGSLFYTYWKSGGNATMSTSSWGGMSVGWDMGSWDNLVCGRGWATGWTYHTVSYNCGWGPTGGSSFLSLYGWTTDPLVEYYVVDNWNGNRPPGGSSVGTVYSDGGTYDLYRTQQVNAPSIVSNSSTFYQYWSVRQSKRSMGVNNSITFQNHVNAWAGKGWYLGSHHYQVIALEVVGGTGWLSGTVW